MIGPYPPPLGGVSVFIYRYAKILKKQGYDVEHFDFSRKTRISRLLFYLKLLLWPRKAVFHLDKFTNKLAIILLLRPFQSKIILHNHSCRYFETLGKPDKILFRYFLKKIDECILVGEHLKENYEKCHFELPKNTKIQPAFLPPPLEEEESIWRSYDEKTLFFIEKHKPLIIANSSRLVFYKGIDLYGLDMCVDLIFRLKNIYPNIGLLFVLAEIVEKEYYEQINRKIDELGIRDNFSFMAGQKELWPIFKRGELMVRPTYSDGYGISIAEALYFRCPAVASDVCKRPEGTIMFKNRNIEDLYSKVLVVFNNETVK